MMNRPSPNEYAPSHAGYISLVPDGDVLEVLRAQIDELAAIAARVPADRETFAYDDGKWTVRQVFGHLGDGERIFGYRALCISRGETASLPGFDENEYVANSTSSSRELRDLAEEFVLTRRANMHMFESFDEAAWRQTGSANGTPVSVNAIAWVMAGHTRHHLNVLRDRYGVA
jgi:hypothetical protein